ncbi:MAG: lipopolysaccharide biosynthesis protein [Methylovirgula sp.]
MIALPFILNSLFNFIISLLVAKFLGPSEYGRYALVIAVALVLQTLGLDWVRLAATRFYSEQDRALRPEVRATLNVILAIISALAMVVAIALLLSGVQLPLSDGLIALTIGAAVANGLFDFTTALVRARLLDKAYGALIISKNALAICLTVGGAWIFGSAKAALIGFILSLVGSLILNRNASHDEEARPQRADRQLALRYAVYALPIVLANVLYQTVPAINRGMVSQIHSFAEAGQLALAFDIGIRIIGAIGAPLDVLLFQLAVVAEKRDGVTAARDQIANNMAVVFAALLPVLCGCWLVLPSFQQLLIPEQFRGAFGHYLTLSLPAMLAFGLLNYSLGPAFQIAHRTLPLILGGCVAVGADMLAIVLLPRSADASSFAIAQSIASSAALVVMIFILAAVAPIWPRLRDIAGTIVASGAMVAAVLPLRHMPPSLLTLIVQAGLGACVYTAIVWMLDVARFRSLLSPLFSKWLAARHVLHQPGE